MISEIITAAVPSSLAALSCPVSGLCMSLRMLFDRLVVGQVLDVKPGACRARPETRRPTKLYDRRADEVGLDEYERVGI
jgi:hypothetical protein